LIGFASSLLFLIGPLFYFYFRELMGLPVIYKGNSSFHFIPFVLLIIYRLPFFLKSSGSKLYILDNDNFYASEHKIIILIQAVHVIIYLLIIKKSVLKFSGSLNTNTPEIEKLNLRWIKKCMRILSFIFYFLIIFYLLNFFELDKRHIHSTVIPLVISFTVLYLGFTGLKLPIIFPLQQGITKGKRYEKSNLSEDKADQYLRKLLSLMEEDKLYLQSDLTLQKLAGNMSVLPNHLSQVINDKMNQNFFDFINSYRVKTAQKLISDPGNEHLTMAAIGYESGFNSKSSFNSAFKKHTGLTPSEYKAETQKRKLQP
jgi:AraC-like DNA-binding protein